VTASATPPNSTSAAAPEIDFGSIGPRIGELFPSLQLPDQHGVRVDLHAARAGRRAMVVFVRSAVW